MGNDPWAQITQTIDPGCADETVVSINPSLLVGEFARLYAHTTQQSAVAEPRVADASCLFLLALQMAVVSSSLQLSGV